MPTPQSREFVDGTRFHHYLEYEVTGDFSASSICEIIEAAGNAEVFLHLVTIPGVSLRRTRLGRYATSKRLMAVQI